MKGNRIKKYFLDKAEAEKEFGFTLYQGGVVPGNNLRIVNIEGVDVEACCGTHHDSTSDVGWIYIIKSQRVSDGIVRLYYCAVFLIFLMFFSMKELLKKLTKIRELLIILLMAGILINPKLSKKLKVSLQNQRNFQTELKNWKKLFSITK